jgi:hypothetical protein
MLATLVLVAGMILEPGAGAPHATDSPATLQDYLQLGRALERVQSTISELETALARDDGWNTDCRDYSPEKTVRCGAVKFQPPGGTDAALSVWRCESGFGTEPEHTDAYHGPFQYMYSTYEGQQSSMPDVVKWFELSPAVHDMRSNILTAIAWASRHGWGPWSCA